MRANFLAAGAGTMSRMNYYAIAQILCRSGAAWNEWKHGEYSTFASSVAAAICSPSTGILSFFIFLMMQPNAYKSFKKLLCCRLSRTDEEEERFKPASSIASSKAPSMYDSGSSRVSSGVRSQSTAYDRESSADPEQYDTPNPIFFTSPSFQQDDWYDDEDIVLARWIAQQRARPSSSTTKNDPIVHPSQRIRTSSAVYARLLDYSTDSEGTCPM
eukprot:gene5120-3656_t